MVIMRLKNKESPRTMQISRNKKHVECSFAEH